MTQDVTFSNPAEITAKDIIASTRSKRYLKIKGPQDLTENELEIALSHLLIGGYAETAFGMIGIRKQTIFDWLDQSLEDSEQGKDTPYTAWSDSLQRAKAAAEHRLIGLLSGNPKAFWQQWAWVLERTRQDRYGSKQVIVLEDITGRVNIPPPPASYDAWLGDTRKGLALQALIARDAGVTTLTCEEIAEAEMIGEGDDLEVVEMPGAEMPGRR